MTKPTDPLLTFPTVCRRDQVHSRRELRRCLAEPIAAAAIGTLTPGCELYGLTKGQFSLVDIIVACLAQTGSADLTLSTWTAAGSDIDFAMKLLADGRIRSMRFIVDYSFQSRQPAYCAALRERFGDDAIRVTKNHCKFVLILNDVWNLAIRTSMNLNENRRLENFEISDDPALGGTCGISPIPCLPPPPLGLGLLKSHPRMRRTLSAWARRSPTSKPRPVWQSLDPAFLVKDPLIVILGGLDLAPIRGVYETITAGATR